MVAQGAAPASVSSAMAGPSLLKRDCPLVTAVLQARAARRLQAVRPLVPRVPMVPMVLMVQRH